MSHNDSAANNYALVQDAADQQRENEHKRHRRSIWADDLKQAERDAVKVRELRQQIEATKQNGREDNGGRLRELGAEHHRLAGTSGGAT